MGNILDKLAGGDRRSVGRVAEVVAAVLDRPRFFEALIKGLLTDDPVIRMRAADAIEKITLTHPEYLQPYTGQLIRLSKNATQQEVRWHMAQILPRLALKPGQRESVVETLFTYLADKSKIVVTFSLQALSDFAAEDNKLRTRVIAVLEKELGAGSPAIKSRSRKLLAKLGRPVG